MDGQVGGERRFLQRIGLGARLLRRDIDRDHFSPRLMQRFQDGLAERLLAVDYDTHCTSSPASSPRRHARESGHPVVTQRSVDYWVPASRGDDSVRVTPLRLSRPSPAR